VARFSIRAAMRIIMAAFLAAGFVLHLRATDALVAITPDFVPYPRAMVYFTGALELLAAIALLVPRWRKATGVALALYVIAVWPANFRHALAHIVTPPIPDSWWYHAPRLAFQPVMAWWTLFSTRVIDWPFKRRP
jgi:uncharacterized membrane protein